MLEISPEWVWSVTGLALILFELISGAFVFLAIGAAALATAAITLITHIGVVGQLTVMALVSGVAVPVAIYKIRPIFSPKGVNYGTTGAGADSGKIFTVEPLRFYENARSIKVNGDQYRIEVIDDSEGSSPGFGDLVELSHFEGTVAMVRPAGRPSRGKDSTQTQEE